MNETYTRDETEAAMCIWEFCLDRRTVGEEDVFDWLRGGEGAAAARDMCILLAPDCERSYLIAKGEGYDDNFDWNFVPTWVRKGMEHSREAYLNEVWVKNVGLAIAHEWKRSYG
jgi:hypothetical protein